jgi:hypothetical protein
MPNDRRSHGSRIPFQAARRQLLTEFERTYLLELLERHGMDIHAAAREAEIPVQRLSALVRKHTRPYFIARVRDFYGRKLAPAEARRIADQLLSLELAQAG